MKYLMLVMVDPSLEEKDPELISIEEWVDETYGSGKATDGDRLRPATEAKTVRRRGGRAIVTDGPFIESHEWIAGFDILECVDLDEAIDYASRHPMARSGRLEIRPFWPFED